MFSSISKYIDSNKKYVIALTKRLVGIPTVNPPGENYEKMVDFLEGECKNIGLTTKRVVVPDRELRRHGIVKGSRRINLIARWNVHSKRTLHVNGHYDIVPPTENWTHDPFKAAIVNGKLYGRGTEDMKGNIACYLFAVRTLRRLNLIPRVNLEFSFTPDEETGGKTGFEWLIKNNFIKADFALGEGFGRDFISYGNKGMVWFEIEVLGKSAHASQPYKGINSFEKLCAIAEELMKLNDSLRKKKTRFGVRDKLDSSPTIVLGGVIKGGTKINIVPDRSVFTVDRRLIPEEDVKTAKNEVFDLLRRLSNRDKDLKFKVKILACERPVIVNKDEPVCQALGYAIHKVLKRKARFAIMPGGTDIRFFIKRKVPAVGYSVLGDDRAHADDEFIYLDSLYETTKVFSVFFMTLR
jgi:succinyl-diaminopimelate desuccinylase